jgi:trehalose/maltose hydrolase-like predicted phosphorylase
MGNAEEWSICETQKPTRELADHLGNKFLIGNGFVGVRGTLDEYGRAEKTACIPTGLYDQQPGKWREPVNIPNPLSVRISVGGKVLHAVDTETERHVQRLDFRRGVSSRETVFLPDAADPRTSIAVCSERFASIKHANLLCSRCSITASRDIDVEVVAGVDGDVWDINGPHLASYRAECSDDACGLFSTTLEKKIPVVSAAVILDEGGAPVSEESEAPAYKRRRYSLKAGQPVAFVVFGYVGYGGDEPRSLAEVCSRLEPWIARGYAALLSQHEERWSELWTASDVTIRGDAPAQHALRYSLYHLLAIAPYHTKGASIPARGLSGQVYKGAIFWDTELFMFPFFLHTNPAIARTLLEYRVSGLPGAKDKARQYGYDGAFYAWESQEGGHDACTHFNVTNVFTGRPTRTFFRDKQIHISGDIPLAFREYCRATRDLSLLLDGGAEVIYECARFLLSWSYFSPTKQRYELLDVTGPDEYHERVNNNYYTNVLSARTLETALWAYATLEVSHPEEHKKILERTKFDEIRPSIRDMAEKLYVPEPDPETGLIPQFDRYFTLEDISLADLNGRKKHPNEYLGGGEGLAVWTQVIKQADVVLTLSTFADRYSTDIKRDNWKYYEPRTEHGSSLSACSYAIVAAEIGEMAFAYEYFLKTATIDITGKSKQYVGDLFIGGTHPAANGGAWLSVIKGFCGLLLTGDGVAITPRLPTHWEKVVVPYKLGRNAYELSIEKGSVSIKTIQQNDPHPRFAFKGQTVVPEA